MRMSDKTFFPFYKERIGRIVGKLQSVYKDNGFCSKSIWSSIASDLYEVFHQASVRCLIAELHICKSAGLLLGKTGKEEYDSYCNLLEDEQYINTIYQKYPGLLLYLDELEENQTSFWRNLLDCLVNDWEEIKEYFHLDTESRILSIKRSGSDLHCKGKSVVIVETDQEKRILYKPYSLENEIFLQSLLMDIYKDLGLRGFSYLTLEKLDYGWVEEVTCEECKSSDGMVGFFKRMGVLVATAYVLGIGDLHYENIIAHGEFPVIIDAETLFQYMDSLYQWTEKTTDFYSVLSSGLLPGGAADQNTAGITGGDGSICTKRIPVIMHDKTSEICVGYQKVPLPEGKNRAIYQGEIIGYEDYEQELIECFRLAYGWFAKNADKVLGEIFNLRNKLRSRHVSGGTQFYGLCLFASVHPELMASKYGRCCYLRKLCKDRNLGRQEAMAMLRGDIPYFFKRLTDENMYDDQKIVVHNFLKFTIMEKAKCRMNALSTDDLILQEKVITYTIRVFKKNCESEKEYGRGIINTETDDKFNGIEYAKSIADYILKSSIKQRDKIYWLEIEEKNGSIKIRPVDIYFYGGIAGIAVFFRMMNQVYGLYEDICEKLEGMLFDYTDRINNKEIDPITEYSGMYCGEGSIGYAYQLLYKITNDKKYCKYANKHLQVIIKCSLEGAPFDLVYGNAGAVLVLCQQYVDTGDLMYLMEAHRVLKYLDNARIETEQGITWFGKAEGNPVCSIAHGNSGVLLAYARVQSLDKKADYWSKMKQIISYEDCFYDFEYGNWADLRKDGKDKWKTYAWCNGGISVVVARMWAANWNPESEITFLDKEKIVLLMKNISIQGKMCLCHGNIGNYIILKKLADNYIAGKYKEEIDHKIKCINKFLFSREKILSTHELDKFGLLDGITGIGLGELILHKNMGE